MIVALCIIVVADPGIGGSKGREGQDPPGLNSFNSMQFLGNFCKMVCWYPLWTVGAPTSGKSWIRHCQDLLNGGANLLICNIFAKTAWERKNIGRGGACTRFY